MTAACASEMLPLNCDPRGGEMSILSDRTDKARFAEASILFLISVALVAAVNIVLFSVASIPLLGASKETLTQSRSYNSHLEDKVVGALVSHMDSGASALPAQTKSPSASNADNMSSSTTVLPSSGMLTEKTLAAPALKPTPERAASTTAVEASNGSTRAPSADETPPKLSPSQEVKPSRASIVDAANPAQDPLGAPMPILVISHEQRHQQFEDLEMQRPHASLDERSVAFAPQIKESMGFYRSFAGPESKSPVRHTAPLGRGTVKADSIANRLNRAELNRLVRRQGSLALSVAR